MFIAFKDELKSQIASWSGAISGYVLEIVIRLTPTRTHSNGNSSIRILEGVPCIIVNHYELEMVIRKTRCR